MQIMKHMLFAYFKEDFYIILIDDNYSDLKRQFILFIINFNDLLEII